MVHIERIVEAAAKIVYGVVVASLLHDRQVILLIVEIHGNRSTVDIFWAPTSTKKQDSQITQHKIIYLINHLATYPKAISGLRE